MDRDSQVVAPATKASDLDTGEQHPPSREREAGGFDPVGVLIDYMLAKTDAEYAAAEFNDVLAIFGTTDIPDDIMAGLEAIQPPIEVDEDGVATVVVDEIHRLDQTTSAQSADIGSTQAAEEVRSSDPPSGSPAPETH